MAPEFDCIVLGLGGMGSAAAYHLAKRGQRVLGLEKYTSPHNRGSSHGQTRIIRQAYFEDPAYVPLLFRAYELWRELEGESNSTLLTETGGLMIGRPNSEVVTGSLRSAKQYGLAHEMLDARELRRRYTPLRPDADTVGLYEGRAGFLRPEACVKAHLDRAEQCGATLRFEEEALDWSPHGGGVRVRTASGTYEAGRLIISPGPWAPHVLAGLNLPLEVERQVLYWFDPAGGVEPFLPERFPIFIWDSDDGYTPYGFPAIDGPRGGAKIAFYRAPYSPLCTPETCDRTVHPEETEVMRAAIAGRIPSLNGPCLAAVTCLYTVTPDKNFIIAPHPEAPQVVIACGFSGHGFKFCSVVGELLAELAINGSTRFDIGLFSLDRIQGRAA